MMVFSKALGDASLAASPSFRLGVRGSRSQRIIKPAVARQASMQRYASSLIQSSQPCQIPMRTFLRRHMSSHSALSSEKAAIDPESDVLCSISPAPADGKGTVATVTISNPRRLNSLSRDAIKKLISTLRSLAEKPDLSCVVIQGAPTTTRSPSFTSGANIFEMAKLKSYDEASGFISELHDACQAVRDLPVVTIARIDGLCLGGGLEFAAACDFRYATHRSTFSMPETKYGIPSVIEARLLPNIIGWQRAKEMCYFAKFYSSQEVEKWGLVDQSLETVEELDKRVTEAVTTIASHGPKAMREQKRLIKVWEENDMISGIKAGVDSYARMFSDGGSEPHNYMKAFTERKR